jgi:hypothetical protein
MIYLLTAIGLTPGGSSTVNISTQTVNRTTQKQRNNTLNTIKMYVIVTVRAVPSLCEFYPGICLTIEEKAGKTLSQGS